MFIYVYADIKTLFQPEIPQQIISGIVAGMTINQSFLFAAALLMSIPPIMILLSLTLEPTINRTGFPLKELTRIQRLVEEHKDEIKSRWEKHFKS